MDYIIGIAGGSGSGKTTFTNRLLKEFGDNVSVLYQDNYYKSTDHLRAEERVHLNYDHPDAIDQALLVEHIRRLSVGSSVSSPVYDFTTHNRSSDVIHIEPTRVLLVEGILIFYEPLLRNLFDLKIYVEADADERFLRRALRDMTERGRSLPDIAEQYLSTVKPMHMQYVEPTKNFADIIINNPYNDGAYNLVANQIRSILDKDTVNL